MTFSTIPIDPQVTDEQAAWFWSHVDLRGPDECWDWIGPGSRGPLGHTRIRFQGRSLLAHRVAFVIGGGTIDNEVVAHLCDRGQCMNYQAHLVCCSIAENNRQRDERNRRTPFLARGADSPSARLTAREAQAIRTAREHGVTIPVLTQMFSISRSSVYNVLRGTYYDVKVSA